MINYLLGFYLFGFSAVFSFFVVMPANAADERLADITVTHQFYHALAVAADAGADNMKAATVGALMLSSARIELTDLDLVQTRDDFVGSLIELDDALAGTRITHRIEARDSASMSVLVCYEFKSNMVLNRELLTFENNLIGLVVQTPIADNCNAL